MFSDIRGDRARFALRWYVFGLLSGLVVGSLLLLAKKQEAAPLALVVFLGPVILLERAGRPIQGVRRHRSLASRGGDHQRMSPDWESIRCTPAGSAGLRASLCKQSRRLSPLSLRSSRICFAAELIRRALAAIPRMASLSPSAQLAT